MGTLGNAQMDIAIVGVRKRRARSKLERRQVVEETLRPGVSVAVIARAHGVTANQVFHWRKLYREGMLDVEGVSTELPPAMLPDGIQIVQNDHAAVEEKASRPTSGAIHIELGNARVRIEGSVDPDCVRAALESLRRLS
jgi:transposase